MSISLLRTRNTLNTLNTLNRSGVVAARRGALPFWPPVAAIL